MAPSPSAAVPDPQPVSAEDTDFDAVAFERGGNRSYRLLRAVEDRLVRRFEWGVEHPRQAQERVLARVLRGARGTVFARDHELFRVRDAGDFQRRVPVAPYAAFRPYVDRIAAGERRVLTRAPVRHLLETSGTTGAAKWIPVTEPYARAVAHAQRLWILGLVREHASLGEGRALTLISAAEKGRTAGGIPYGSNTGRMHLRQPWWLRRRYPVPYPVYCLADPEVRLYAILRFALEADIRSLSTANPTTLLLLARKLREHRASLARDLERGTLRHGPAASLVPRVRKRWEQRLQPREVPTDWRPARLWDLAAVNCWKGGGAAWFLQFLPRALGADLPVNEVGISASETYLALSLSHTWPGCVAWPWGEYQEFLEEGSAEGPVRQLWELEPDGVYRVVVTGRHGLYRYDLGDLVQVVGRYRNTPVLRFLRRAGAVLSTTGEKVTEEQVVAAMRTASREVGHTPVGFTVGVALSERPTYRLAVEPEPDFGSDSPLESGSRPSERARNLARAFDAALRAANVEYDEKRGTDRLRPARVVLLPQGTYARLRAEAVARGTPEGQYKDPLLAWTGGTWDRLEAAALAAGGEQALNEVSGSSAGGTDP